MTIDPTELPNLAGIFDLLRSGRHLCAADGAPYIALNAAHADYAQLFAALGFELVGDAHGFFYFRSDADIGKEAAQLAVFFFVLVEAWSDSGRDIEATVFDAAGHRASELPHLGRDSWRKCMDDAGVDSPDALVDVVRRLERYGFVERIDDDRFCFRAPAWRFLDLCRDVRAEHQAATPHPAGSSEGSTP